MSPNRFVLGLPLALHALNAHFADLLCPTAEELRRNVFLRQLVQLRLRRFDPRRHRISRALAEMKSSVIMKDN